MVRDQNFFVRFLSLFFLSNSATIAFSLSAFACLDYTDEADNTVSVAPRVYEFSNAKYEPPSLKLRTTAGGDLSFTECPMNFDPPYNEPPYDGFGSFQRNPQIRLVLKSTADLQLQVKSLCDSILIVHTAAGQWFVDDDEAGNWDARMAIDSASAGHYDVWIGEYSSGECPSALWVDAIHPTNK